MKLRSLRRRIEEKARELGADLVGVALSEDVRKCPSMKFPAADDVRESYEGLWKADWIRSFVILAVVHPPHRPELDWWVQDGAGEDTPGNRILRRIASALAAWIEEDLKARSRPLPYHVEKGGIFLKDAAVYAGLGCIGKNNLLVTPRFGPKVRLRAVATEVDCEPSDRLSFGPCEKCPGPCRTACPRNAFILPVERREKTPGEFAEGPVPGRDGAYQRERCWRQMLEDERKARDIQERDGPQNPLRIRYCRRCEWACPVGESEWDL